MKCKYKYRINGKIKPSIVAPIPSKDAIFEFEVNENGVATYITVTVQADDESNWPTVKATPDSNVKYHIKIGCIPQIRFIQMELRVIEGLLALWGVHSIDINNPEIVWIPENAEEKRRLPINNYKTGKTTIEDKNVNATPFDIIARSIIGASKGFDDDFALSFYRRGQIDIDEERYIEAIYDFYFLLESILGNGKFQKKQVSEEFKKSSKLIDAIKSTLEEPGDIILSNLILKNEFDKKYKDKSPEEIIDQLIDLRGFLHHHTSKRKEIWHPENQSKFEIDARIFQLICYEIAFDLSTKCVFDPEVTCKYEEIYLNGSK